MRSSGNDCPFENRKLLRTKLPSTGAGYSAACTPAAARHIANASRAQRAKAATPSVGLTSVPQCVRQPERSVSAHERCRTPRPFEGTIVMIPEPQVCKPYLKAPQSYAQRRAEWLADPGVCAATETVEE